MVVAGSACPPVLRVAESDTDNRAWRSLRPVKFLAFEADQFAVTVIPRTESGRHHGHAAGRTDRRTVVSIHATSIPVAVGVNDLRRDREFTS
jgi:hypothetical protein